MSWAWLLLGVRLSGVVDRVEGDVAVVEWASGGFGDVPVDLLPPGPLEGRQVVLRLVPRPAGDLTFGAPLASPHGPLSLPADARLRVGGRYRVRSCISAPPRASRVWIPRRAQRRASKTEG